jgi:hypothetical protein
MICNVPKTIILLNYILECYYYSFVFALLFLPLHDTNTVNISMNFHYCCYYILLLSLLNHIKVVIYIKYSLYEIYNILLSFKLLWQAYRTVKLQYICQSDTLQLYTWKYMLHIIHLSLTKQKVECNSWLWKQLTLQNNSRW